MNHTHLLLRYGEIFLKGKNRPFFEKILVQNIKKQSKTSFVTRTQKRLILPYFVPHEQLRAIFGIVSYSPAVRVEKDIAEIEKQALDLLQGKKGTFKIITKRADKQFPLSSMELNRKIGMSIEEKSNLVFSAKDPRTIFNIEINNDGAYLFLETIPCFGGLPVGTGGKVLLLVETKASILAGLSMLRRGCTLFPIAFEDKDISLLQRYSPLPLRLEEVKTWPEIESYAKVKNSSVLVVDQRFAAFSSLPTSLTVFRPLLTWREEEIEESLVNFQQILNR